jgi:flavin reductase (DIM6/NTAB) family NADH-FMN oxidoreductase RutF
MMKSIGAKELVFPSPVFIIGTYDSAGRADMTAVAWAGVASSDPPSVVIAVRPSRLCHVNIIERKAFTVAVATEKFLAEADYFGIVSGRDTDKLADTGLTAARGLYVDAPYIEELPEVMECELTASLVAGAHSLFVGTARDVRIDEAYLGEKGAVDWRAMGALSFDWSANRYYLTGDEAGKAFSAGLKFRK